MGGERPAFGVWLAVAVSGAAGLIVGAFHQQGLMIGAGALVLGVGMWQSATIYARGTEHRSPLRPPYEFSTPTDIRAETTVAASQRRPSVATPPTDATPVPPVADASLPTPRATPDASPVTPRIPPGLEPGVVLAALMNATSAIPAPVSAHLWLADEATATFRQVSAVGSMPPSAQPIAMDSDDAVALAHGRQRAELAPLLRVHSLDDSATIWRYALPIRAEESRGVAAIDFKSAERPDVTALPAATAPLRAYLAGALALYVARCELETAQALIEAARDLSRILDPQSVIESALDRAMDLSGAQTGSIMLADSTTGRLQIAVARGLPANVVEDTSLAEGEGIAGWVFTSGQPLLIEDLPARSPAARRHGVRSAVSVPLADDDGILGVLNVGSRSFPARFTQSHLSALQLIGKQTTTALRNARAVAESRELYFDTLKALAIALETKDPYSRGGTERVLEYAEALGGVFELANEDRDALRIAALLHDIGMAAAGQGVVVSGRPLTTVERGLLRMHPQIAAEILAEGPALRRVVPIVYHHHEWFDGAGYISGVAGENIPLESRILAVADAFVAMTSERPYRAAYTPSQALKELAEKAGTQFDPAVVDALRDILSGGSNRVPGSSGGF